MKIKKNKNKSKILTLSLTVLLLSSNAFAELSIRGMSFNPFIGVDAGVRNQNFERGFGDEQFRHHYPLTNFYIGSKFCDYWGFELGYEYTYRQQKNQFYYQDSPPVLGYQPLIEVNRLFISDAYAKGWHLDLLGFFPICPKLATELTASIGVAWIKMYYQTTFTADSNVDPGNTLATPAWWQSNNKAALRASVGLRQMFTPCFGSRLQIIWENTSHLGASVPIPELQLLGGEPSQYTVKSKNGYVATLGFFYELH